MACKIINEGPWRLQYVESRRMMVWINQERDIVLCVHTERVLLWCWSDIATPAAALNCRKGLLVLFILCLLRRLVPLEDPFKLISLFYCVKILLEIAIIGTFSRRTRLNISQNDIKFRLQVHTKGVWVSLGNNVLNFEMGLEFFPEHWNILCPWQISLVQID